MSSLKEIRETLVYFYMVMSYQMRNSFSCTMKSSEALCYSKANVRRLRSTYCHISPRSTVLRLTTAGNRAYTVLDLKR